MDYKKLVELERQKKNRKFNYFEMVAALILAYKESKINDIDLFNSIIRLVYFSDENKKVILKSVVDWLNFHEKNNTPLSIQYDARNVKENVGEDYFEGLTCLFAKDMLNEEYFKTLNDRFKS